MSCTLRFCPNGQGSTSNCHHPVRYGAGMESSGHKSFSFQYQTHHFTFTCNIKEYELDGRTDGRTDESGRVRTSRTNGRTDECGRVRTNGRMDGRVRTDGRMDERTNGRTNGRTDVMKGCVNSRMRRSYQVARFGPKLCASAPTPSPPS